MSQPLIASLRRAVAANPDDLPLRLHLAELLLGSGDPAGAVTELATVLATDPANVPARRLMAQALAGEPGKATAPPPGTEPKTSAQPNASTEPNASAQPNASTHPNPSTGSNANTEPPAAPEPNPNAGPPAGIDPGAATEPGQAAEPASPMNFDWSAAEEQLGLDVPPMFLDQPVGEPVGDAVFDLERPRLTLAEVGGMAQAKQRLEASFLAPLRNPELRRMYRKSLRGGLLMYGPPGCGKTYLARALAGELQAGFISVQITDILDQMVGNSERNVRELFLAARRAAPCVLFFDEVDALGQRRSQTRNSALRGTINQLLAELDGVEQDNDGVFVLAATNQPWDVDPALRRPGRLDRTVLILPPDEPAREAIFRHHLRHRPIAGIDTRRLAKRTDGLSGADIAYTCELAAENALLDSAASGQPRPIGMPDVERALASIQPSIGPWLETARNLVTFGEDDGTYAELRAYLKRAGRL
jgi:AAA+ superfamily predicted ATPase